MGRDHCFLSLKLGLSKPIPFSSNRFIGELSYASGISSPSVASCVHHRHPSRAAYLPRTAATRICSDDGPRMRVSRCRGRRVCLYKWAVRRRSRSSAITLRALGRGLDATGSQATAPDAEGRLCDVVGVPAGAPSGSAIVALSQLVSQRAANASLRSERRGLHRRRRRPQA